MNSDITIVMYHYVRDLINSRHPNIKGLNIKIFEKQIKNIKKKYNVIGGNDFIHAIHNGEELPENSALLTFDDGYVDHFTNVFPILDREGITGCFFPSVKPIVEGSVLDVNKIQFIMANIPNENIIIKYIYSEVKDKAEEFNLLMPDEYWKLLAKPTSLDSSGIVFCKLMLQYKLPFKLRTEIIHNLFVKYVTNDEVTFSKELYMSRDQLITMRNHGMYIGSHGYDHMWMDTISAESQEYEIDKSLEFLKSIGASTNNWIMCYPYGAYSKNLVSILKEKNCIAGLSTEAGVSSILKDDVYALPRIDTVNM